MKQLLQNMYNLAVSMPTNLAILAIICLLFILLAKYTIKDCVKIVISYLVICVLLSFFGLTMPSFITIFNWIKQFALSIFNLTW